MQQKQINERLNSIWTIIWLHDEMHLQSLNSERMNPWIKDAPTSPPTTRPQKQLGKKQSIHVRAFVQKKKSPQQLEASTFPNKYIPQVLKKTSTKQLSRQTIQTIPSSPKRNFRKSISPNKSVKHLKKPISPIIFQKPPSTPKNLPKNIHPPPKICPKIPYHPF